MDTTPGRALVVGYVSPDLFTHSVSYFAEAPLTHHRQERVRPIVYRWSTGRSVAMDSPSLLAHPMLVMLGASAA